MQQDTMNHVDTIKVEHNNHSCHIGLTVRNGVNMNALLDDTRDYCHRRGLHYVTCADVPGYMNDGCSTVHVYNGKYGKGIVRTRPCFYKGSRSTNYMTIEYWVARDDIHKRLTGESEGIT